MTSRSITKHPGMWTGLLCMSFATLMYGLLGIGCGPRVECRRVSDCEEPARYCALGLCKECYTDNDCRSRPGGPYCDAKTFRCTTQATDGGPTDTPSGPCLPKTVENCYTGPPSTRNKGLCKDGKRTCLDNGRWSPCANQTLPTQEVCDSKDNNCDGKADEGLDCTCAIGSTRKCYDGPKGTAGIGSCREGIQRCLITTWGPCSNQVKPSIEKCDKVDNDCDGKVDENLTNCTAACAPGTKESCYGGPASTKDKGICKSGTRTCSSLRKWGSCVGQVVPAAEKCDGLDNDCDGQLDELPTCKCTKDSVRSCRNTSNRRCTYGIQGCTDNGTWGTCVTESTATAEKCDGKDNDCDGKIDDSPSGAPACPKQQGVCKGSKSTCVNGKWSTCDATSYKAFSALYEDKETKCDLKDNNCDGLVDENVKGCVTTIAGTTTSGYRDGKSTLASFNNPAGLAFDANGKLLIADGQNNTIRMLDLRNQNNVTGIAGSISPGFTEGKGSAARFNGPIGIAISQTGITYIADRNNHRIRIMDSQFDVKTLAGLSGKTPKAGYLDGTPDTAMFNRPQGMVVVGQNNVYVADTNNHLIRRIDKDGNVTTVAGICTTACSGGLKNGEASQALFKLPTGIAYDGQSKLYITDAGNHCIRVLDLAQKQVTTFAGVCGKSGNTDSSNAASLFNSPHGIVFTTSNTLYVADRGNYRIRKISGGKVSTLAGSSSGSNNGPLSTARFRSPTDLAIGPNGHLFVSNQHSIRMIVLP